MFFESWFSEVADLDLATNDPLESNFTRTGITPFSAEKCCSFLSEWTVNRISTPAMLSIKHIVVLVGVKLAWLKLIIDIKIGNKFAFFSISVAFLSLTGKLLSIPTAAAFSASDIDEDTILTIILRWVSPNCSISSSCELFERVQIKFKAPVLILVLVSVKKGRRS